MVENNRDVSYDDKMLEAFVGVPEKVEWYKNAFKKYNVNGVESFAWNWSWWAFFGGAFFLLYRKVYLYAVGLFIVGIVLNIPLSAIADENVKTFTSLINTLSLWIISGGVSTFLLYKKYIKIKQEIENKISDTNSRIETMKTLGGVNSKVIWITIISFVILLILGVLIGIGMEEAGYEE